MLERRAASLGTQPTLIALCGPTRTGKTVALSLAVSSVEASALYVTTYQMADVPKPYRHDETHPWNTWRTVDVLAIDEVHADESVIPRIRSLLYERWDNGRCTLLAGNLTVSTFMARYLSDEALRRRVMEEYGPDGRLGAMEFAIEVTGLS
jgi:predicted AAA+ superfamily ATPase